MLRFFGEIPGTKNFAKWTSTDVLHNKKHNPETQVNKRINTEATKRDNKINAAHQRK